MKPHRQQGHDAHNNLLNALIQKNQDLRDELEETREHFDTVR